MATKKAKQKVTKELKQKVWWLMYDMAKQEDDYLRGMIITITDEWDDEQWVNVYKHMSKNQGEEV